MGAGVGVSGGLLLDGGNDRGMAVADVERADTAGEVKVGIAIHIRKACASSGGWINVVIGIDATRQVTLTLGIQRLRARSRDRGDGRAGRCFSRSIRIIRLMPVCHLCTGSSRMGRMLL